MISIKTQAVRLIVTAALIGMASCSTPVKRTKYSDKNMRILLDPESISPEDYVRVQQALVASGKWAVIDRSQAFQAIQKEQERLHRDESDRFDDKQKYAHWGRLFGVGAVVVGHSQCTDKTNILGLPRTYCQQFLNIVDANTGEVITAVENENNAAYGETPDWEETVAKLNDSYPEDYQPKIYSKKIADYEDESKERAIREKEGSSRHPAGRSD